MKINKQIPGVLLGALLLTASVKAQSINAAKVPAAVKSAFMKAYPTVKAIKWEKEKDDFEAGFKAGGKEMSALFKADGTQLESETAIPVASLPAGVQTYITQHYPGVKIREAAKIIRAGGEVNYEAEVKGKDLLFDASGKFIKAQQD